MKDKSSNGHKIDNDDLYFKWNLDNLEVRTKSVERTLAPLVNQVTTLVDAATRGGPNVRRRGKSKKADVLVAAVEKSIENFLDRGAEIVRDNPEAQQPLSATLTEVRTSGSKMVECARMFAKEPCSSQRRQDMVSTARALLSAVTRLMIVADMVDVQLLLRASQDARRVLQEAGQCRPNQDQALQERLAALREPFDRLDKAAGVRGNDLLDNAQRDNMQAARAALKTASPILYTACKAYVRHSDMDPAKRNKEFAVLEMNNALTAVEDILRGQNPANEFNLDPKRIGELAAALNSFDQNVFIDPNRFVASRDGPALQEQLERIITGVARIADRPNTRDERKSRIVAECNNVRQALLDLLSEYEKNVGKREPSEDLDLSLVHLSHATKGLRRHLRRAVVDHVSDHFLDTNVPLILLVEAARQGKVQDVEKLGKMFLEHAEKLQEVAELTCTMSSNAEGVKMVRYAIAQIKKLAPQVINAARLLAVRPQSVPAQSNMDAFCDAWTQRVRVLTLAVDSMITLDDFIAVSEAHVVDDVKACIEALISVQQMPADANLAERAKAKQRAAELFDRAAGAIRGRSLRVCDVVDAEMDFRPPRDPYVECVRQAVRVLRNDALPDFARKAEIDVGLLRQEGQTAPDINVDEFINVASNVHKKIVGIRQAILMNRDPGDIDSDEEYEEECNRSERSAYANSEQRQAAGANQVSQADNQQMLMKKLPQEEKKKINEQIQVFRIVQHKFEREVARWDETGNDIVVLAKYMCMIMMDMTDFTRGRGPLKTTMDVINAAKKISEAGTKLNALAKQVADESVESETKKDLLAYLQRITLYCQQLNITSKVKADVQQVGDELIVSGLESATSLIQASKNLLNAVVLTVKSAYIASTKYPAKGAKQSSLVVWKMRAPDKKPLVRKDDPTSVIVSKPSSAPGGHGVIRRASQRREMPPIKVLQDFSSPGHRNGDAV